MAAIVCTHYVCRCRRAEELASTGRTVEAIAVHADGELVPCRTCCPSCGAADTGGAVCKACHEFNRDAFRPPLCT